jgi:ferredoxin-type protein NapH
LRWRWMPWAVLAAIVLLSAALLEPVYCRWLCPFKAVTEFPQVRNFETAFQMGIFISLFLGLVVVLPWLTKKRTQCSFFCPFGGFQSIFNKIGAFEVRIDREKCKPCVLCEKACPTLSIGPELLAAGAPRLSCMRCGACVDSCPRDAAVWHIKGTKVGARPELARLLHLYSAWAFAVMFGGGIIATSLTRMFGFMG